MSSPSGGGPNNGGEGGEGGGKEDEEPEVKIDGQSYTLQTVNSISNAQLRAEAKIQLNRKRKKHPLLDTLPIKTLDAHGNKISIDFL